jgi:iron complex transport system substrate-binding protein
MKYRLWTIFTLLVLLVSVFPAAAQEGDTFPVTVEHKFGSTTITEAPQRVVAIGFTEQDFLLALGVTPVAVRYWYGDENDAIFPWADEYVEGEAPVILNMPFGSLNYEAILALQPDLISAVTSGITQEEYELLTEIAPTIAQSDAYINFGMPWQEVTKTIGAALGKSAEAETLVADVENLFADTRASHPEFEGKTVSVTYFSAGTYGFYTDQDSRGRFFTELGFVVPQEMIDIAGEQFYADVSAESVGILDQDLIAILNLQFIEGGREALEAEPLFSQLTAVQEGRVVYLEQQAENALGFSSPLSLAYALDAVLPQLEAIFSDGAAEANLEATSEATADTAATTSCEAGFRLFEDENIVGEAVCVPETAERIVALDPFYSLQMGLEMGLPIIGSASYSADGGFPEAVSAEALESIALAGGFEAPNLEAITALNPDLIIGDAYFHSAQVDLYNEIAPTVLVNTGDWKAWYRTLAAAAGVPERAETAFDEYDARITALQALVPADVTVSFLRMAVDGFQLYREAPNAYAPIAIMTEAGVVRPDFESGTDEESFARLDYEGLANIEGDILLYVAGGSEDDGNQLEADTLSNPIWQALPAVQAGQAYRLDFGPWMSFGGLSSAHAVLDDLFRYVAGVDPQEVSPNPFLTGEAEIESTPEATTEATEEPSN